MNRNKTLIDSMRATTSSQPVGITDLKHAEKVLFFVLGEGLETQNLLLSHLLMEELLEGRSPMNTSDFIYKEPNYHSGLNYRGPEICPLSVAIGALRSRQEDKGSSYSGSGTISKRSDGSGIATGFGYQLLFGVGMGEKHPDYDQFVDDVLEDKELD
jgi:hypothetical protein